MKKFRSLFMVFAIIFNTIQCMNPSLIQQERDILEYIHHPNTFIDNFLFLDLKTIYKKSAAKNARHAKKFIIETIQVLHNVDDTRYASPTLQGKLFYWLKVVAAKKLKSETVPVPQE